MKNVILFLVLFVVLCGGGVGMIYAKNELLSFIAFIAAGICLGEFLAERKFKKEFPLPPDWVQRFREREEKRKKEDGHEE